MKKQYMKPSMKVYQLQSHPHLLQYSGYPGEVYAPGAGIGEDMNKLA